MDNQITKRSTNHNRYDNSNPNSNPNPSAKRTIVTTYRGDIRDVVTLFRYLTDNGLVVKSLNDILRSSIEAFASLVREKHPELTIDSIADAAQILKQAGLLSRGSRSYSGIIKELQRESLAEHLAPADSGYLIDQIAHGKRKVSALGLDKDTAKALAKELEEFERAEAIRLSKEREALLKLEPTAIEEVSDDKN